MKNISKFLILLFASLTMTACLVDDEVVTDNYGDGPNFVGFESPNETASFSATGEILTYYAKIKLSGPTSGETTEPITVNVSINEDATTAEEGVHYLPLENTSYTLTNEDNYMLTIPIQIVTDGIQPPLQVDPILVLQIDGISTADSSIIVNGLTETLTVTMSYKCFSDLAGTYYITYSDGSTLNVPVYQTGVGEYRVDNLFTVTPAGFDWYFSDTCGVLKVTGFELSNYTLNGTGVVNPDGSLTFTGLELVGVTGAVNVTMYPLP